MKDESVQIREAEGRGKPLRQYVLAVISNIGMFCCGVMFGWTSPIQPKLEDPEQTPLDGPISATEMAWTASLVTLAGIAAPFVATFTVDRFGRKFTMILACIPFVGGWLVIALANTVAMLYAARLLQSIGSGVIFIANLNYITEIATNQARGTITSMIHLFITFGILVMYSVGPFVSYHAVAYFGMSITGLYFVMLWFIPESPNYYVLKGNNEAAKRSLMTIRGKTEEEVEPELEKIKINLEAKMSETKAKISDLWLTKAHIMSLVISCMLLVIQQLSGYSVVLFYMVSILAAAGSTIEPAIASILVAAIQVVSSLVVPIVVERLGRKVLLIVSLAGIATSLGVLGAYFKLQSVDETLAENLGWLPLLTLVTFMITYCLGIGPLVWTIAGEVFPAQIKTLGTSITSSVNYTMAFVSSLSFNYIQEAAGAYTAFWICCGVALFGIVFIWLVVPETKQKSLQEIQELLNR